MYKHRLIISVALLIIWVSLSTPLHAEIYTYIDKKGTLHFTNTPVRSDNKIQIRQMSYYSSQKGLNKEYDYYIEKAAVLYDVPFPLIKAMIKFESDYNPEAVSQAGAKGLMQLMPENIKAYGVNDPFDPHNNIMVGTKYFKMLCDRFNGDFELALAAYNAGPTCVEKYDRIPPYEETKEYVQKVMDYYHRQVNKGK